MSKIVHPYAHRLIILRDWKSRWFADPKKYVTYLKGDVLIRQFLEKKLRGMYISSIEIERSTKNFRIIIESSRPGFIIGRNGEGMNKLRDDIIRFIKTKRHNLNLKEELKIDIKEVKSPESNATIVSQMIADGLEKRLPFRRVTKQMIEKVMANRDVLGVKIELSGRLGGASMARQEKVKRGRIPLQTFRADVDFTKYEARLPYGGIGIKVWIYRGEIFSKK